MNLTLWIITGLLTVVALTGGVSKTFVPKEKLAHVPGGGWTKDHMPASSKRSGSSSSWPWWVSSCPPWST